MSVVLLPRADGSPIRMMPTTDGWVALEAELGALGEVYLQLKTLRFRFESVVAVMHACAREAGEQLTRPQVRELVHAHGLLRSADLALELLDDLFKPAKPASEAEGEGDGRSVPLPNGDSGMSSPA